MNESLVRSQQEFQLMDLGDKRRVKRFHRVMEKLFESSNESLTQSMGSWCEAKAAYRLFDSEELTEDRIFRAHREQIKLRAEGESELLFIHDTSNLNFTSHTQTQGLGSIAQGFKGKTSRGIFIHTSYVLNGKGLPLGVADQLSFTGAGGHGRSAVTGNLCWVDGLRYTKEVLPKRCVAIHVADREADYWDFMSEISKRQESFVIRLVRQRSLKPKLEKMYEEEFKDCGKMELEFEHRQKQPHLSKYHQQRRNEKIELALSVAEYDLSKTVYSKTAGRCKDLKVRLVRAVEINPPKDREAVEWILKTDLAVTTPAQARRVVKIYEYRWQIELFHKVLKSGCQVEKTRFSEAERIKKYVAAMSVVAWRLHYMTMLNRHVPDQPCSRILNKNEWRALYCKIHKSKKLPKVVPTINQAIRWIAILGGFLGRKSDGDPGMVTIWRGWNKLTEITEFYEIFA